MNKLVATLSAYWYRVQTTLFPYLQTAGLELTPELKQLVVILDLLRVEEALPTRLAYRAGAPPKDRAPLARSFIALHYLKLTNRKGFRMRLLTDDTLRRICGWETPSQVPSETTFCRAFALFADLGLADQVHAQRVQEWLGDTLVWQQALDATDITARETPQRNPDPQYGRTATGKRRKHPKSGRPKGRPNTGESVKKPCTRLERQLNQVPEVALLELPTACDTGFKPDTHGHPHYWTGYKFHVITNEHGVPLCAVTTAASVHGQPGRHSTPAAYRPASDRTL